MSEWQFDRTNKKLTLQINIYINKSITLAETKRERETEKGRSIRDFII